MQGYGFDGWGMFWGGGLLMILFWIGVIALIFWGFKSLLTGKTAPQPLHSALSAPEIIQARYAQGEISRDEYLVLIADLQPINDNVQYSKEKRSEF